MVFKRYYELTKSGLVFGNLIPVIAGFLLGTRVSMNAAGLTGVIVINPGLFLATLVGIFLVMASGCVFNNYIDRDIDPLMERTKDRVLATGAVSPLSAIVFGSVLGIGGGAILARYTNMLTLTLAFLGFFFYVLMYSAWWKRNSVYGTFVGALSGATPPVVGYCAATGHFDAAASILFLILAAWQMPHFFAIAIRRADDYSAAGIPVLPVRNGINRTKSSMLIYIVEFVIAASLLWVFGYEGYFYLGVVGVLGAAWLVLAASGFSIKGDTHSKKWARNMFFLSLIVLMVLFITITIGAIVG